MVDSFWKSKLTEINEVFSSVKKGTVKKLAISAGGREIRYVEYGEKEDFGRKANYMSACGAGSPIHYANKSDANKPVLLIVGGIHGGELEGIAAVTNLIQVLETGEDFRGKKYDYLYEHADRFRLLVIPCMNPDGRARLPIDTLIDVPEEKFVYYMQGTWKDGTLCRWPDCKAVHPIKEASGFLGSYFNDDGVNMMHDNFFNPMARETSALLGLADEEAPDFTVLLHGGANYNVHMPQIYHLPLWAMERMEAFNQQLDAAYARAGIPYTNIKQIVDDTGKYPFPAINLTSAIHHVSGSLSFTFESNMGLDAPEPKFSPDQILDSHFVLFEEMFRYSMK
ncbi:Zinc carboxypeptidase [Paenibacillus sp. UNCCL117]|uniref:M14 family zinc carboxypeptidase n=1 Tax=unclassified Paenibacillus TaxID=185978 RepID=UPI00087FDF2A|nr:MULTISPECIES: M14 family zinc carboxypeptidase [unclassified Paenibacillus]SDE44967.1 Zinc carboxypeptidase [Paenibacillus sp. cl123]SFW46403.1 Zinc carboxypeptidase [Paenibacillus sp. UNCCL117]